MFRQDLLTWTIFPLQFILILYRKPQSDVIDLSVLNLKSSDISFSLVLLKLPIRIGPFRWSSVGIIVRVTGRRRSLVWISITQAILTIWWRAIKNQKLFWNMYVSDYSHSNEVLRLILRHQLNVATRNYWGGSISQWNKLFEATFTDASTCYMALSSHYFCLHISNYFIGICISFYGVQFNVYFTSEPTV